MWCFVPALACFWQVSLVNPASPTRGLPTMAPFDFAWSGQRGPCIDGGRGNVARVTADVDWTPYVERTAASRSVARS